jgi:hypothetical protein
MALPATLQINLAPGDAPHARHTVPHHLRQLGGQVEEILLTVDLLPSPGPRGAHHAQRLPGLLDGVREWERHPSVRVREVDYGAAARAAVAERFFGGAAVPQKDCVGAPFYAYLHGLHEARHDLVLHLDSDMLLGGGSQAWLAEAAALLAGEDRVAVSGPLPGPPTTDGRLPAEIQWRHAHAQPGSSAAIDHPGPGRAYEFSHVSTRSFLVDRERLLVRVGALERLPPPPRAHRRREGHEPVAPLEISLTEAMRARGLVRVDLLGSGPGMWVVHPPLRSEHFYAELPGLIRRIEAGDVPDEQRGDFELNDSMVDWSSARDALPRVAGWKRVARRVLYGTRSTG